MKKQKEARVALAAQADKPKIILASGSPRRGELLKNVCAQYTIKEPQTDERKIAEQYQHNPRLMVKRLALAKAKEIDAPNAVVIGADTVVVANGEILGKPADKAAARKMISSLSGKTHRVLTGVAIVCGRSQHTFCKCSRVRFAAIPQEEIEAYINTDEPYDKAGAYAVQGWANRYVKKIRGDYFNVVGLPCKELYGHLKRLRVIE